MSSCRRSWPRYGSSPDLIARVLEFTILTAARSAEAREADWCEIDLAARTWTVPATRMKAKREHRVALSDAAVALLEALPGARTGSGLSQLRREPARQVAVAAGW